MHDEMAAVRSADVIELKSDGLTHEALQRLALGDALVLHVRQFIDPSVCRSLAQRAEGYGYSSYLNVPSVRRIGMAYYETEGKSELIRQYFEQAKENTNSFRRACLPFVSPIDTLRCVLDETWRHGAQLQTLFGQKMFIGLSRMVEPGTTFLAHHDIFAEDAPGCAEATELKAQFGANIYLQMPQTGGSLLMWQREIPSKEFAVLKGDTYGIKVEELGTPDLVITPRPGDLLIFNSRKIHAVSPGVGANRLALSCFVGYRGESQPLTYWS